MDQGGHSTDKGSCSRTRAVTAWTRAITDAQGQFQPAQQEQVCSLCASFQLGQTDADVTDYDMRNAAMQKL